MLEKRVADIIVTLIPSSGGVFEVVQDGKLIFSKNRSGRFPTEDEIIQVLQ